MQFGICVCRLSNWLREIRQVGKPGLNISGCDSCSMCPENIPHFLSNKTFSGVLRLSLFWLIPMNLFREFVFGPWILQKRNGYRWKQTNLRIKDSNRFESIFLPGIQVLFGKPSACGPGCSFSSFSSPSPVSCESSSALRSATAFLIRPCNKSKVAKNGLNVQYFW